MRRTPCVDSPGNPFVCYVYPRRVIQFRVIIGKTLIYVRGDGRLTSYANNVISLYHSFLFVQWKVVCSMTLCCTRFNLINFTFWLSMECFDIYYKTFNNFINWFYTLKTDEHLLVLNSYLIMSLIYKTTKHFEFVSFSLVFYYRYRKFFLVNFEKNYIIMKIMQKTWCG